MILCSAEPRIISCLPTHVINLVINDNSLEILYIYIYTYTHTYIRTYICTYTYNLFNVILVKLPFQLKQVTYLYVSLALICVVLYLKKIILSQISMLNCLIILNSVLFFNLVSVDLLTVFRQAGVNPHHISPSGELPSRPVLFDGPVQLHGRRQRKASRAGKSHW